MRRSVKITVLLAAVLAGSGCTVYQSPPAAYGHEHQPRVVVHRPEFLYLIPTYGIYFVPNVSAEVFHYNGRWYYSLSGTWYWGTSYAGPWTYIEIRHVPIYLKKLPSDYRTRYGHKHYRVPYGHWKKRHHALPPGSKYNSPPFVMQFKNRIYIHPHEPDVIFHDGYWYRRYNGLWYQGKSSNGPWRFREVVALPKTVRNLPPDYWQPGHGKPYKVIPWAKVEKKYRKKIRERDQEWGDY